MVYQLLALLMGAGGMMSRRLIWTLFPVVLRIIGLAGDPSNIYQLITLKDRLLHAKHCSGEQCLLICVCDPLPWGWILMFPSCSEGNGGPKKLSNFAPRPSDASS